MRIKAKLEPGKVALVTGGSSGIGKAIACELAGRGMDVWLAAQRKNLLESARMEIESNRQTEKQVISTVSMDVSDLDQVHSAVKHVMEKSGPPDLLVNSAGVAHPGYVQDLDINIYKWMMEVNYFGTVYMTKEVLPIMIPRGTGYIVNISSIAGYIGIFGYTAYGASKYAVRGFTETLRSEMKYHNIGVSIVFPPDTDTAQLEYENQFKPPETRALGGTTKPMAADEVARVIIKGIEHGKVRIFPGLESALLYRLDGLLGGGASFILDQIVAKARKNHKSSDQEEV